MLFILSYKLICFRGDPDGCSGPGARPVRSRQAPQVDLIFHDLPDGEPLDGDVGGHHAKVENAKAPGAGFVIDLTPATELNKKFFTEGPGYSAKG